MVCDYFNSRFFAGLKSEYNTLVRECPNCESKEECSIYNKYIRARVISDENSGSVSSKEKIDVVIRMSCVTIVLLLLSTAMLIRVGLIHHLAVCLFIFTPTVLIASIVLGISLKTIIDLSRGIK